MRLSRTRSRLACAGLTAGAIVAALLVAPTAANAAALSAMTPVAGPVNTTVTVTAATSAFTGDGAGAIFTTATSCPATYNTTAPNIAAGNPAKVSGTQASFTVPTTLTLGTAGAPKSYNVCAYVGTVVGTSTSVNDPPTAFNLIPGGTVSPATGPSGGGNTITLTMPSTAAVLPTTPGVTFAAAGTGCPATYGASPVNPSGTVTRTSTTVLTAAVPATVLGTGLNTGFFACVYSGTATGSTLLAASTAGGYAVTLPSSSLNTPIGPPGTPGTVNLTVTGSTNIFTGVTSPVAVLVASPTTAPTTCSALYPSSPGVNLTTTLRKTANNKAALTVPTGATVSSSLPTPYNVCMYSSTSTTTGKLLSVVTYTAANVPTISAVTPNSGTALGGSQITVTGAYFPTAAGALTATLGGSPLTSITPVDANTFTAVTPAHNTGSVTLTVSTAIGSDSQTAAYTYVDGISISPNTAPNSSTAQDVDVQGTGFLDYAFSSTANTGAHVYLVNGTYNGRAGSGNKANGPVADCGNVLVIGDNELVCSLNLTTALNPGGTAVAPTVYRTTPTATVAASSPVVTLSTGTFGPNDVGEPISDASNTNIPAGTTILAVLSPTTAIMSANSNGVQATPFAVTVGYQSSATTVLGASGAYTIGGGALGTTAGVFTQADVGRVVAGTNVGTNAVVVAVDPTGTTATLSLANTGAVSSVTLSSGNPVPNGAYNVTIVSNAAANAATTDDTYHQTVISSTSTFTVAPF
jgi:hypothetical protein